MQKTILFYLMIFIIIITCASNYAVAGYVLKTKTESRINRSETMSSRNNVLSVPYSSPRTKSGFLAYLSAGSAILGILIGTPQLAFALILLGTLAGITGKIGLKLYRGRPFLRTLCYIGIILGAIVLAFGMVPLLFLV